MGVNLNPGSIQGSVKAIVADINAHGGLLGRKIVPVFHDNKTVDTAANPDAAAQQNCADFTSDHRVVAIVNRVTLIETNTLLQCLEKSGIPLLSNGASTYDPSVYAKHHRLFTTTMPDLSGFAALFAPEAKRMGYLSGWDTTLGKPSNAPTVVGLLEPDNEPGHAAAKLLTTQLQKQGVRLASPYFYTTDDTQVSSDMQAAVLKFKTENVTHMVDVTNVAAPLLFFASAAQNQKYYPRWAMTSWLLPTEAADTLTQLGAQKQLVGSMGIGWTPANDVNTANSPADTATAKSCKAALRAGSQDISGDANRLALENGLATCDALHLLIASANSTHGLSGTALSTGLGSASKVLSADVFGFRTDGHALPVSARPLAYKTSCGCFQYTGPNHRF